MKGMIVVDVVKCIGCHTCELSCVVAHSASKTLAGAITETPRQKPRVHVECVGRSPVPMQCKHCEDAPCVTVCPSQALSRAGEGEPVLFNPRLCIGCNNCLTACPFGSIGPGPGGRKIMKCDLCVDRLKTGEQPACCSCPTGALRFISGADYAREKRRLAARRYLVSAEPPE